MDWIALCDSSGFPLTALKIKQLHEMNLSALLTAPRCRDLKSPSDSD